ncbi:MAG: two component, sigma54 specific, transcriptional regulator, Fis family [Burkholderiales bacterium]|nr:two component, sigma54 specific, transcriptional regulator, Fis family [Burkholderiales bacterium]
MRLSAAGYAVTAVESGEAALAALAVSRPQVVVTDLRMQGMDGMALFDAIHRDSPSLPVLILTAHGTIPEAVTATRRGVFSFLTKPFEPKVLLDTVAEAMRLSSPPAGQMENWRSELITRSSSMEDLLAQARRVAASDASVCIFGQSGTGKELLARAIHRASPRSGAPFVEFREDLYYRLNVVKLYIPSLAERREDIPLLANEFLNRLATRYHRGRLALSPEAMQILVSAPWPGNVRQLLNVIEQAVALAATGGNVTKAARLAGRNRTEFYRLLERHSLEPGMFKGAQKEKATA